MTRFFSPLPEGKEGFWKHGEQMAEDYTALFVPEEIWDLLHQTFCDFLFQVFSFRDNL